MSSIPVARLLSLLAIGPLLGGPIAAQQRSPSERDILESQRRLEEIRQERSRLQLEMGQLQSQAEGASSQLRNIERQLSASRSVLAELDFQVEARTSEVDATTEALVAAQRDLERSQRTLRQRLRSIYKRGPLHTVRVLLTADSFANLLTRYRYLRLAAAQDRTSLEKVGKLQGELTTRNRDLQEGLAEMHRLRDEKVGEVGTLQRVETQRQRALARYRTQVAEAETRLATLAETEQRLAGLIGDIEDARIRTARATPAPSSEGSSGSVGVGGAGGRPPADPVAGTLDWPVEGSVAYTFGRERQPNGTVLRWNGLGISAPLGAPVRSVLPGTVALAGPFEGYGPTVVISHGEGLYTLYLYLDEVLVLQGRYLDEGEVLGTVGGADTPEGPHVEFQIRGPVNGSAPQAMDPLAWLRSPGGP